MTRVSAGKHLKMDRQEFFFLNGIEGKPMYRHRLNFTYSLFGLVVHSELELPEVTPFDPVSSMGQEVGEVEIVIGDVFPLGGASRRVGGIDVEINGNLEKGAFEFLPGKFLFVIPTIGRFLVENGKRITVEIENGAAPSDVRIYLLGPGFGTLLHQRGLVPLHISAIAAPTGVWAFTGPSGAGKSTIAALINHRTGWPLICDDVAVLRPQDDEPILYAGMLRIKLCADSLDFTGVDASVLISDPDKKDKFQMHAPELFSTEPSRMRALVTLDRGTRNEIIRLKGTKAFETLMNAVYRPSIVPLTDNRDNIVRVCMKTAHNLEAYHFQRIWSVDSLDKSTDFLIDKMNSPRSHRYG